MHTLIIQLGKDNPGTSPECLLKVLTPGTCPTWDLQETLSGPIQEFMIYDLPWPWRYDREEDTTLFSF